MTTRLTAPQGAPTWIDLFTTDVDSSRRFYADVLGWTAQEPSPEFGGYFMFNREEAPTAGGMGPQPGMEQMPAAWNVYLAVDDLDKTLAAAQELGAQVVAPAMDIADLGRQAGVIDPTGAYVGQWQAGWFPGFTVLGDPGAPAWFELHTGDHAGALDFYTELLGWETDPMPGGMKYATVRDPQQGPGPLAGLLDTKEFGFGDAPAAWTVYFDVADVDATIAKVEAGGGKVVAPAEDTPFGRMATVSDPTGAVFRLAGHRD